MREHRTKSEQKAIDALKKMLVERGKNVSEDEKIKDKPDAVLIVEGIRVAVECRILSPEMLMYYHGVKREPDKLYQLFLPREPHVWIGRSIEAKNGKIKEYKERGESEEAWLVVHVGFATGVRVGRLEASWEVVGYAYGTYKTDNNFDRIYVVHEQNDEVLCIYRRDTGYCIKEIDQVTFPKGNIPIEISFFGHVKVKELDNGRPGITLNLNNPAERLCLQPLDLNYGVDYSEIENLSFSNIGTGSGYPELFAYEKILIK